MDSARGAGVSKRASVAILIALIVLGCGRIVSSYRTLNQAYDEGLHIACGMEWLSKGTYTYDYQHPPLARVIVALGPYLNGLRSHSLESAWDEGNAILQTGGDYWRNLTLARLGSLLFFTLACVLVYWWSERWFSRATALCAVFLFSTLPPVLGHGGLATNDLSCCASTALAAFCMMRWAEEPSWKRAAALSAALAFAVMCKMSSVFYLSGCGIVLAVAFWVHRRDSKGPALHLRLRLKQLALVLVGTAVLIWGGYRFSVIRLASIPKFDRVVEEVPALRKISKVPLPLTELFLGVIAVMHHNTRGQDTFLLGQYGKGGWWYFFPVVVATKTPLGLLLVALLSFALARRWIGERHRALRLATVLFPVLMLAVAMSSRINMGVRHILPIYPFLAIVAAQGLVWLYGQPRTRWIAAAAVLLLGFDLVHTSAAGVDQLAYFNPIAGSHPENVLCESDLDWGQDLHRLSLRLRELGVPKISIAYFGTLPLENAGLPAFTTISGSERVSGYVAVSARYLTMGPQKDGSFVWLKGIEPSERIGRSIFLFRVPPMIAGGR
jgi:hypothetical protein